MSQRIAARSNARKGLSPIKQNRHSVDQIIAELRQAAVELGKGTKVPEVSKVMETRTVTNP